MNPCGRRNQKSETELLCFSSLPVSFLIPALRGLSRKLHFYGGEYYWLLATRASAPDWLLRIRLRFLSIPVSFLNRSSRGLSQK